MKKKRILAILGSTKKESSNRVILELVAQIFSEVAEVTVYDRLASLPHFNPDSEAELPKSVQELREAIEMADGILISTPEYVFSIPGSLKNAIEWQVQVKRR